MYNRLLDYLNKNYILCHNQYGFREKHSTYMALLNMIDDISNELNNNNYSIGVFEAKIAIPTTGGETIEECHNGRTTEKLVKSRPRSCEHVAIHSSVNRSTHISHIIIFPLAKAFAAGKVKSVRSVLQY